MLKTYAASAHEVVRTARVQWPLLKALAKRDLSDEYVGHGLSMAWPIIQPLFGMIVYLFCFTFIFPTRIPSIHGYGTDATVFLLAGIIPWLITTQVMSRACSSVVNNSNIVKQMTLPLELLPLKTLASPLLYGGVSLVFLVFYSGIVTHGTILLQYILWGLPLLFFITIPMLIGLALTLSAAQVFLRDIREFVIMFSTVGIFVHPILFLPGVVPMAVRPILYVSPLSYTLFCWQDALFYGQIMRPWAWGIASLFSVAIFLFGARLFVGARSSFGDFL